MNLFNLDPSLERNNYVLSGVQHKYSPSLVILTTNKCFNYCDHCFRKRIFNNNEEVCIDYGKVKEYIENHPEITNILLTGGDPLTLSTCQLEEIIMKFIPKGLKIRLGTSAVSYKPNRFDKKLISLLRVYKVDLHLHINDPYEYNKNVVCKLRKNGIILRSQTVLLKGINDDIETLKLLFINLVKDGISPYYIFHCRPTLGNKKYCIPIIKGIELIDEVKRSLSGMEKHFRYVMSNKKGKVEILGIKNNKFVFKYHQHGDSQKINQIKLVPVDNSMVWWNDE